MGNRSAFQIDFGQYVYFVVAPELHGGKSDEERDKITADDYIRKIREKFPEYKVSKKGYSVKDRIKKGEIVVVTQLDGIKLSYIYAEQF